MKAAFKGSEFCVDLVDLAKDLPPELMKEFAQLAVFQETLMEAVVDTVVTGTCFEGWYIGDMAQRLRTKLVPMLPDATRELVEKLIEQNERLSDRAKVLEERLQTLRFKWPEKVEAQEFDYYHGEYRFWNRSQVDAYLKSQIPESEWESFFAAPQSETVEVL